MKGEEFERRLYDLYRREEFRVSLTPKTNDKGIDLLLKKGGRTIAVQAKGYAKGNKVDSSAIQKASGLLTRDDIDEVIVATSSSFTSPAREVAKNRGVELERFSTVSRRTNKRSDSARPERRQNKHSASSHSPTYSDRTTEAEEYACPNCGKTLKRTGWGPYYRHFKDCALPEEKPEQLSEEQWSKVQEKIGRPEGDGDDKVRSTALRFTSKADSSQDDIPNPSDQNTDDDEDSGAKEYSCPTCGKTMKRTGWGPYYHHFKDCALPEEKPEQLSEEQWSKVQEKVEHSEVNGGEVRSTALRFTSKANSS